MKLNIGDKVTNECCFEFGVGETIKVLDVENSGFKGINIYTLKSEEDSAITNIELDDREIELMFS